MHRRQNNKDDELTGKIFLGKYKPEKKLGEGSFGKIYSAVNVTDGEHYALKMENKDSGQNLLESESYFLCYLKGYGIPAVKSYGFSGHYNIMVMELLGKSLEDLFQDSKRRFSLKTVCLLAQQMLDRMEFIHNKHIIHRDIKPDNFVMGLNNKSDIVYILDFGLAKKYRSSRTLQHIKFNINKKLTGTARYASINALRGCEQSRRDDLEAIGYVLMYFLRGSLPWQGLKVNKGEDRYKKIYQKKKATKAEDLCEGYPKELCDYINYTRNLDFEADPDYDYLRGLFASIMEKNNIVYDFHFKWMSEKPNVNEDALVKKYTMKYGNKKNISDNIENEEMFQKNNGNYNKGSRNDNNNNKNDNLIINTNDKGENEKGIKNKPTIKTIQSENAISYDKTTLKTNEATNGVNLNNINTEEDKKDINKNDDKKNGDDKDCKLF